MRSESMVESNIFTTILSIFVILIIFVILVYKVVL